VAKVSDLIPDASNANRGTERGRYALEASLRKYGAGRSILLDREGRIIAGNKTAETAADVGIDDVIVVQTDGSKLVAVQRMDLDLDSKEARELAYADNRVGQLDLDFDPEQILADLQAGVDLDQFWRKDELDELLADLQPKATEGDTEPQVDRAEELRQKWQTAPGQLWQLGEHRLICGDCTDVATVARVMGGEKAQAVVTDPPYGIGWDTDYTRFTTEYGTKRVNYAPVTNDDKEFDPTPFMEYDKVVLWGANWYCKHIPIGTWLVWDKRHPNGTAWLSDAELAWMKGGKGVYIYAETVQGAHRKEKALHPTQKPVGLMQWCIEKAEIDNDIFDPYAGSGTTIIACENLSRRCRAVEISPAYVAVALERWSVHTGKTPVLI
jgi:site-specific DNA-methyltransferase (adenine-specific)